MEDILLSICIPTFNRPDQAEAQVKSLLQFLRSHKDIEVVVSDNCSVKESAYLKNLELSNFRYCRTEVHFPTAEENIINAVDLAKGKFVWFLGDDDPVHLHNLEFLFELLRGDPADCLVFNSATITNKGGLHAMRPVPVNAPMIEGSISGITESIGLLYTFAGISNIIQRRALLSRHKGLDWIRKSKIYSHVAWLIEANRSSKISFYNMPIVFYRQNDYSDGHWDRTAEKLGVQKLFFWSIGLARLLHGLVNEGVVSYASVGRVFEISSSGHRYRLIDDIAFKTFEQIRLSATDARQTVSDEDLKSVVDLLIFCDPLMYDAIVQIKKFHHTCGLYQSMSAIDDFIERASAGFIDSYNHRQALGHHVGNYVASAFNYEIYKLPLCFVAIRNPSAEKRAEILNQVDPIGDGRTVLTAISYSKISEFIRNAISHPASADDRTILSAEAAVKNLEGQISSARNRIDDLVREMRSYVPAPIQAAPPQLKEAPQKRNWMNILPKYFNDRKSSGGLTLENYFDRGYYLQQYGGGLPKDVDALTHYMDLGWKSGFDPSPNFSTNNYLSHNIDVFESGMNPLVHYLRYGAKEGRQGWQK